jgi:hypothetical protein
MDARAAMPDAMLPVPMMVMSAIVVSFAWVQGGSRISLKLQLKQ